MVLKFHHNGILCKNIEEEIPIYKKLGYDVESEIYIDPIQQISCLFMCTSDLSTRIELIKPTSDQSPVMPYVRRNIKMYHQAFICDNILDSINSLIQDGAILTVEPVTSVAFNGKKIAFLMLPNQMLIEIIEKEK
jgi:methylmalonyl-CoA/ethylmalonyl-CoA epimerase